MEKVSVISICFFCNAIGNLQLIFVNILVDEEIDGPLETVHNAVNCYNRSVFIRTVEAVPL